MTLTEFLLARISEDEGRAKPGEWEDVERYICRPYPAHVLAECAAKRRIVEDCAPGYGEGDYYAGQDHTYDEVLRMLALPYADHPDYNEGWKP